MQVNVEGPRPDPARVPYILDSQKSVRFEFNVSEAQSKRPLLLRIHAADQSAKTPAKVVATINGRPLEGVLPQGLGIQQSDPAHLAFPATLELPVKAFWHAVGQECTGGWCSRRRLVLVGLARFAMRARWNISAYGHLQLMDNVGQTFVLTQKHNFVCALCACMTAVRIL